MFSEGIVRWVHDWDRAVNIPPLVKRVYPPSATRVKALGRAGAAETAGTAAALTALSRVAMEARESFMVFVME